MTVANSPFTPPPAVRKMILSPATTEKLASFTIFKVPSRLAAPPAASRSCVARRVGSRRDIGVRSKEKQPRSRSEATADRAARHIESANKRETVCAVRWNVGHIPTVDDQIIDRLSESVHIEEAIAPDGHIGG